MDVHQQLESHAARPSENISQLPGSPSEFECESENSAQFVLPSCCSPGAPLPSSFRPMTWRWRVFLAAWPASQIPRKTGWNSGPVLLKWSQDLTLPPSVGKFWIRVQGMRKIRGAHKRVPGLVSILYSLSIMRKVGLGFVPALWMTLVEGRRHLALSFQLGILTAPVAEIRNPVEFIRKVRSWILWVIEFLPFDLLSNGHLSDISSSSSNRD